MRHLKICFPILSALVAAGLYSCADESPWGNGSDSTGSISLSLSTVTDIKTAKPQFRSGEDDDLNPNHLSSYTDNVPESKDFSIRLEKVDGSWGPMTWTTLGDFEEYNKENLYPTGTYTMTAFYGTKGEQDFDKPYFEASSTFNVLIGQEYPIELNARLMNSMVKINYTDAFRDYMKDFHANLSTEGRAEDIVFNSKESRVAFVEPTGAKLFLYYTTKRGFSSSKLIAEIQPLARTLHNITLDITDNPNGDATLQVNFDDTLEDEDVEINLTDELKTTPAPVIACDGFVSGETIDMLERGEEPIKMEVTAKGIIASAVLTIESSKYTPGWGNTVDLCKPTAEQLASLKNAKIDLEGSGFLGTTDMFASLDLTEFCKTVLPEGEHNISLKVTDKNDAVSEPAIAKINKLPISISLVESETPEIAYGSGEAEITINYNGLDPRDVSFNIDGRTAEVKSYREFTSTRASDMKTYTFLLGLGEGQPVKETVDVTIYHQNSTSFGPFTMSVEAPSFKMSRVDAFSRYAYIDIDADNSSQLKAILRNLTLKINGSAVASSVIDEENGYLLVTGLTKETSYTVVASLNNMNVESEGKSFTTESEQAIPNGDFSSPGKELKSGTLKVGGKWHPTIVKSYQHTSSFLRILPADWATINDSTAWTGSKNQNTWYVVPSSWLEEGKGFMRNVGFHHNGRDLQDTGSAGNTTYYCTDHPEDNELNKAAGELFLGTYSYDGVSHRNEGIDFESRPTSISFDFAYTLEPKEKKADQGYAYIEIIDINGTSLIKQSIDLHSTYEKDVKKTDEGRKYETKVVNIEYGLFTGKAKSIIVKFKSSNQAVPPIHIPTGSELNENQSLGNHTLSANSYHAVATGSELTIDNVKVVYGDEPYSPAKAPNRNSKKRR